MDARKGELIATEGPTEQYPAQFELGLSRGVPGQVLYRAAYQSHPSPLAKWDDGYCELQNADDALCFPRVIPHVGYTHDRDGGGCGQTTVDRCRRGTSTRTWDNLKSVAGVPSR